ncbi:GDP-4-dehydro-6-deoxy-D-mannose reductase [Methylosinus sp. sav-2]|uniref:NAD-dependent epimerase/dehydratase family protein n=1 Tax=Methylosinus sp. sav-2 TaxID=2485168 RepID=UPI00047AF45D|nr:NAD-dependent epimerase/dehydratase family protein [Methylosinus sp. sav-2]TDX65686.1 GDP-4-dehydro-6-deoxy-D-mannose reductase [Methylosinus sp. sav-2]
MSVEAASTTTARYERILVTGGSGFVGRYVLEALARAYPAAHRLSLARPGEPAPDQRWTPIAFDLLDAEAVDAAIAQARPDLVIHLAAQASAAQSFLAAEETWRVNFDGAFNLASALARHAPAAVLLFASTADVYGASLVEGPAHEDMIPRPLSVYARSKLAAESMLADVLPQTARLIVARPFSHIGPGQDKRFAVASFAAQIVEIERGRAEPRLSVGDLSVQRDFLDVRDVVDAYLRLIAVAPDLPARNVFDIASGETRPLASLVEKMRALARRDFEIVVDPDRLRPADIPIARCAAGKMRAATGWSPRRTIDETLVDLLDHWRAAVEATK